MNMKKIVFTGIILVLVMMFVVTCDTPAAEEVEYTDVVYSPDTSEITLYLDGVGVPVTPAQRAVNKALAEMAYDYFEVVFAGADAANTARASWELGQLAGIYNVPRGATAGGINYGFNGASTAAAMFVGKKADKTLLGVGYLKTASPAGTGGAAYVAAGTSKVTFYISAIQTGLLVDGETGALIPAGVAVTTSSFTYTGGGTNDTGYTALSSTNSARDFVNGSPLKYPRYSLPAATATINATYTFSYVTATGETNNVFNLVKIHNSNSDTSLQPAVKKRVPRFMSGGRYMEPKEGWTTTTSVDFTRGPGSWFVNYTQDNPLSTDNKNVVGLQFVTNGSTGVFSFYIQLPVYMLTNLAGGFQLATAIAPEVWYIRTGVGSELYSLDDGIANGGCVFMSVGASAANWLNIEWQWI